MASDTKLPAVMKRLALRRNASDLSFEDECFVADQLCDNTPVTKELLLAEGMVGYRSLLTSELSCDKSKPRLCWRQRNLDIRYSWTFNDEDGDTVGIDAPDTMGQFRLLILALNITLPASPGPESAAPRSGTGDTKERLPG